MAETPQYPGAPRWVKALGVAALILALLFIAQHLAGGGHGPWSHFQTSHGASQP